MSPTLLTRPTPSTTLERILEPELLMDTAMHSFAELFRQLGLPDDYDSIERFLETHRPLPRGMALPDAPFWSVTQSCFLRDAVAEDADWAELVDDLGSRLAS